MIEALEATRTRRVEDQWGTVIGIDVCDPVSSDLLDDVFGWFVRVDDLFSTWRVDSQISRLARREISLCDAAPEVREVLERCDGLLCDTRGAFDIRFAGDPRCREKAYASPRALPDRYRPQSVPVARYETLQRPTPRAYE